MRKLEVQGGLEKAVKTIKQRRPTDVECRTLQRAIANMNFLMGWGGGMAAPSPHFFMCLSWVPVSCCRSSGVENKKESPLLFLPFGAQRR